MAQGLFITQMTTFNRRPSRLDDRGHELGGRSQQLVAVAAVAALGAFDAVAVLRGAALGALRGALAGARAARAASNASRAQGAIACGESIAASGAL